MLLLAGLARQPKTPARSWRNRSAAGGRIRSATKARSRLSSANNKVSKKHCGNRTGLGSYGDSKAIIRFTEPAEVKGVALLVVNHPERSSDQWMWTPAIGRDRRIAQQDRSTRFFGTDFSFEDLEERDVNQFIPAWIPSRPCTSSEGGGSMRKDGIVLMTAFGLLFAAVSAGAQAPGGGAFPGLQRADPDRPVVSLPAGGFHARDVRRVRRARRPGRSRWPGGAGRAALSADSVHPDPKLFLTKDQIVKLLPILLDLSGRIRCPPRRRPRRCRRATTRSLDRGPLRLDQGRGGAGAPTAAGRSREGEDF